jgi:hypothetical protein
MQDRDVLEIIETEDAYVQKLGHVFASDRQIWERQPWEDDRAFELFSMYRDLPPLRRSQGAVVQAYKEKYRGLHPKDTPRTPVRELAVHNRWVERVEAYSMYVDDRLREALEEERVKTRVEYLDLGREMREKATQALHVMKAIVYDEDGKERSNLSPRQVIDLAKAAHEFERFALMMDEPDRGTTVNIMNVSDSELLDQAKEVLAAYGGQE